MDLEQHKRAVIILYSRVDAEHALKQLVSSGFSLKQISIVTKDADGEQLDISSIRDVWYKAKEGTATGATITGSMLGAIGGCLVGIGFLAIPGVNLVIVGASGMVAATIAGAGIGVVTGSLLEAVACLKITSNQKCDDSDRFSLSEYLVIVSGTEEEMRRAESILSRLYSSGSAELHVSMF